MYGMYSENKKIYQEGKDMKTYTQQEIVYFMLFLTFALVLSTGFLVGRMDSISHRIQYLERHNNCLITSLNNFDKNIHKTVFMCQYVDGNFVMSIPSTIEKANNINWWWPE